MDTGTEDRTLVVERVIKATPGDLFDAWTDPETLVKWWGPEGTATPEHDLDVREGGPWTTTMQDADGERYTCSGVYKTIDRPNRLAFTWGWRQPDGTRGHETLIEVTFKAVEDGTRMTLTQSVFESAEQRDNHGKGWISSFNDLEKLFA